MRRWWRRRGDRGGRAHGLAAAGQRARGGAVRGAAAPLARGLRVRAHIYRQHEYLLHGLAGHGAGRWDPAAGLVMMIWWFHFQEWWWRRGCKCERWCVRFTLEEINIWCFPFFFTLAESGEQSVSASGSLCLACYMHDVSWSWKKNRIIKLFQHIYSTYITYEIPITSRNI